jgi:tetratricopeptide (TPR) repeat protein
VYAAYVAGNTDSWERILKDNREKQMSPAEEYEFAFAHYGFIGYCISREEKQRARPYLDHVEKMTNRLMELYPDDARYIALRGALYGFRIFYQPQKAMFIGPKALRRVTEALEMDAECPHAWIENANKDYWMPEMFGGSKTKALAGYEKAISLMEKDPASIHDNWFYLSAHMVLASWNEERGRSFTARELYRKVRKIEPAFVWAREKLGE